MSRNKIIIEKTDPPVAAKRGRPFKYPFPDVQVGESFTSSASYKSMAKCVSVYKARYAPNSVWILSREPRGRIRVSRVK